MTRAGASLGAVGIWGCRWSATATAVVISALFAASGTASARDGTLDRSFGSNGRVPYSFAPGSGGEGPGKVIVLKNGRIFSGGTGAGNGWGLALHDRRGDPVGLGGVGLAYHQISPGPGPFSFPADFARQSDGRWVGAGYVSETGGQPAAAVARFTGTGALDSSFGNDPPNSLADGIVRIDFPGATADFASAVTVDRAGRLLVTGKTGAPFTSGPNDIFLARLRKDGSPDPSFGEGGFAIAGPGTNDQGEDVAVLPSGNILVAGVTDGDLVLLRYRPSGRLDKSFGGGDGIAEAPGFGIESESNAGMVLLRGGKILVGINDGKASGMSFKAVVGVARFTAKGRLDHSFSGDGKQRISVGDYEYFGGIAVADDGRIVLSAVVRTGTRSDVLVARLLPAGARDPSFGTAGIVVNHVEGLSQGAFALAIQPDRRIVVGADTYDGSSADAALIRLLGDTRRPGTKITAGPSGRVSSGRVSFRFRVLDDVHARFQCALSGAQPRSGTAAARPRFSNCRSPRSFPAAPGPRTFLVRAIDPAGNIDRTPASRSFTAVR